MLHTLTNRCYPLVKNNTLMSNHLEGKEMYSGNTSYLFVWQEGRKEVILFLENKLSKGCTLLLEKFISA